LNLRGVLLSTTPALVQKIHYRLWVGCADDSCPAPAARPCLAPLRRSIEVCAERVYNDSDWLVDGTEADALTICFDQFAAEHFSACTDVADAIVPAWCPADAAGQAALLADCSASKTVTPTASANLRIATWNIEGFPQEDDSVIFLPFEDHTLRGTSNALQPRTNCGTLPVLRR